MSPVLWLLAVCGATLIVTRSTLFAWLRPIAVRPDEKPDDRPHPFREFFACPQCVGFWVGAIVSLIHAPALPSGTLFSFLVHGWIGSLASSFAVRVWELVGALTGLADELRAAASLWRYRETPR
jgi:hypothetical protein